jgi:hypothetical protein
MWRAFGPGELFPSGPMYRWLTYGQVSPAAGAGAGAAAAGPAASTSEFLRRREFSITKVGDIYVRYLCFGSEEEFRTTLEKQRPIKIDIGAVYTKPVGVALALSPSSPNSGSVQDPHTHPCPLV